MRGKCILFLGLIDWDFIQQRPQHFARLLAESNKVIYVNPIVSVFTVLRGKTKRGLFGSTQVISNNLTVITPPVFLPFSDRRRLINKVNSYLFKLYISVVLNRLDRKLDIIWSTHPKGVDVLKLFPKVEKCYDCMDKHTQFHVSAGVINNIAQMERDIVNQIDFWIASSNELGDYLKGLAPNIKGIVIQNGVDFQHFNLKYTKRSEQVIGFVGTIGDWVDIQLLIKIITKYDYLKFEFIGPVRTNVEELSGLDNVVFMGQVPYQEIPKHLARFSACLIPFKINSLTEYVNPVKVYEYLAAGKRVIATDLPGLSGVPFCIIAKNADEFARAIETAITEQINPDEMKEFARANTWRLRLEQLKQFYETINRGGGAG